MEVSDPSGKVWDGTAIHESLKRIKNTCGDKGKNACSNVSSDQARHRRQLVHRRRGIQFSRQSQIACRKKQIS